MNILTSHACFGDREFYYVKPVLSMRFEQKEMKKVLIEKIILNMDGILYIKPKKFRFDMIYRSAMGVHWDESASCLYHNPPQKWSPAQWYNQIIAAVKSEYGIELVTGSKTIYENISSELKEHIENHITIKIPSPYAETR